MKTKTRQQEAPGTALELAAQETGPPFKRVLVPLDGSPVAEQALPYARVLGRTVNADVILVRVAQPGQRDGGLTGSRDDAELDAITYLVGQAERVGVAHAIEYSVPYGDPAREIAAVAEKRAADLIVMTTHGHGGLRRLMMGSVADALVRETRVPLLLVRSDLPPPSWEWGPSSILVPLDGSSLDETTLAPTVALARLAHSRVTLLRVIGAALPEASAYEIMRLPADDAGLAERAEAELDRVAQRLRREGLAVETEVAFGDPGRQIVDATAGGRYDLVAMTTRVRERLQRAVVGSVADVVLRQANAPLLLFRA